MCCPICHSCGVTKCFAVPFRWESSVFRDTIYEIIILYSWNLVICEHFWPYAWNNWSWVMHTMSTWFWYRNRVWQSARHGTGSFLPGWSSPPLASERLPSTSCIRPPALWSSGLTPLHALQAGWPPWRPRKDLRPKLESASLDRQSTW
jgi:hypothetical protein